MNKQKETRSKIKQSAAGAGTAMISSLALLFSACCIGPLAGVVAFIGISGTTSLAIANLLGPFEPYLLGTVLLSLVIGFYYSYRSEKIQCADDKVCATSKGKIIERVLLWISAVITTAFIFYRYIYPKMIF